MAHTRFTEPAPNTVGWEHTVLKPVLDEYAQGLDSAEATTAAALKNIDAVVFYSTASASYPARSTVTTDTTRRVVWVGPVAPTIGGNYAVDGLDAWERTTA